VEIEIPFGALILPGGSGGVWAWNVTRERHAGGSLELSSWAPMQGSFHQPEKFGKLLDMPTDYRPFSLAVGEMSTSVSRKGSGESSVSIEVPVTNETGADLTLRGSLALLGEAGSAVSAEPVAVAAGDTASFAFPPLVFRSSASDAQVEVTFADSGGRVRRKVIRRVSCEIRPLTLSLLQPCYRNAIFPGQDVRELLFRVIPSADVRARAERIEVTFAGQQGDVAAMTVAIADASGDLSLPIPVLADGTYILRARALKGQTEVAAIQQPVSKLPRPEAGRVVRIDRNRNLLVDGKPFFGIGWYGGVPTDDPRADVVALQNVTVPAVINYPDTSAIRDNYDKHGIYTVVSVENGRLYHTFDLWRSENKHLAHVRDELHTLKEPSDDTRELLRKLVEAVRGEPGLLGYYIADEPEIHNVPSEYLENMYAVVRELDPYHPVFVTNDTIDGLTTHGFRCADVLSPDPYSADLDYVPNFLKKINEIALPGQAWYVTLWHSTSQTHFKRPFGSAPPYSYRTFRNQYFSSICYGAKGFTPYTSAFFMPEIEYRFGLPPVWRELRFLEPAILAPEPEQAPRVEGAADVPVWARTHEGRVTLIAVNHKTEPRQISVRWAPLENRTLTVMSEGRTVRARNGAVALELAPGDVRILTDAPGADAFPTTAAVTAELAERYRNAVKPGNLLHSSRGVSVGCSEGYFAPWFHQYYYYAINGLIDDKGWTVSHGKKDKPDWIEFTLPEPAPIGRLVMMTPTIRDYRIDFMGPDGTRKSAAFTGNRERTVVHGFDPPVTALKIRVTVTGINSDRGPHPVLSEIEAYSERRNAPVVELSAGESAAPSQLEPLFPASGQPTVLWADTFSPFEHAPQFYWDARDTRWVLSPETLVAEPAPGGGLIMASRSPKGYAAMSHFFPYDPACRFFQVSLRGIEGKGYRFTNVALGDGSGKTPCRGCINTARPGIYTVDTHYIHNQFRTGAQRRAFVRMGSAGSRKTADGAPEPGPRFTFDWIRLVDRPLNGLAVTLADGAPLPGSIARGDSLRMEVHLEKPATDVTVEALADSSYKPVSINGAPYVQLARADETGRLWVADVTLGEGTTPFKCGGYPLVFRAAVTGGAISETYASAFVSIE
jgi:hypothetical protein